MNKKPTIISASLSSAVVVGLAILGGVTAGKTHSINPWNIRVRSEFKKIQERCPEALNSDNAKEVGKFVNANGRGTLVRLKSGEYRYFEVGETAGILKNDDVDISDWAAVAEFNKQFNKIATEAPKKTETVVAPVMNVTDEFGSDKITILPSDNPPSGAGNTNSATNSSTVVVHKEDDKSAFEDDTTTDETLSTCGTVVIHKEDDTGVITDESSTQIDSGTVVIHKEDDTGVTTDESSTQIDSGTVVMHHKKDSSEGSYDSGSVVIHREGLPVGAKGEQHTPNPNTPPASTQTEKYELSEELKAAMAECQCDPTQDEMDKILHSFWLAKNVFMGTQIYALNGESFGDFKPANRITSFLQAPTERIMKKLFYEENDWPVWRNIISETVGEDKGANPVSGCCKWIRFADADIDKLLADTNLTRDDFIKYLRSFRNIFYTLAGVPIPKNHSAGDSMNL